MKSIAEFAVRWVALRDDAKALAEKRAPFLCERAHTDVFRLDDPTRTQEKPCWKTYHEVGGGQYDDGPDLALAPESEWCEPCRQRQSVHRQLRKVTASRGAVLRALIAAVHRATAEGRS